jgi:AraC-like DNA-binding protein
MRYGLAEEGIRQALPTVAGFGARLAVAAVRKRNVATAPLLRRAGLSEHVFESGQNRISAASQCKVFEHAAEAMDDSAFGLHLAEGANPREAGLVYYVVAAANSLGEALAHFARYSRIVNETLRIKLVRTSEGIVVQITFVGLSRHSAKQANEFGVAVVVKALREITGQRVHPTHLSFVHGRNSDLRAFERFFGCTVEFGASVDQFALSNQTLALPLVTKDRYLFETLQPVCDEAAKERGTTGTLRAMVENEVQKLLPHGDARRHSVAKALGLSERTLTRKLTDEGTTYEQVVDELRRTLALQYIKENGVSLSQIAWLLGYGGSTSFNHAFRRWTGRSPTVARNEKRLPPPASA